MESALNMVVNVYNDSITDDERFQVYRQILQLFISSGGSMNNGNERDKEGISERCDLCAAKSG